MIEIDIDHAHHKCQSPIPEGGAQEFEISEDQTCQSSNQIETEAVSVVVRNYETESNEQTNNRKGQETNSRPSMSKGKSYLGFYYNNN